MTADQRGWSAVAALAAILAITASWWSLALWPVGPSTPAWFVQTRAVCFGTMLNDLPNAGGWLLLVGQPLGMFGVLATVWTAELRAGFALAMRRISGQLIVGLVAASIVAGLAGVVVRVSGWEDRSFSAGPDRDIATALTRVNDEAPALSLVDQHGRQISIEFSIQLLKDADGLIEWVVAIVRDVTERFLREKNLRAELKAAHTQVGDDPILGDQ